VYEKSIGTNVNDRDLV